MIKVRTQMSASAYLMKIVSPNRGTFKSKTLPCMRAEPEPKVAMRVEHTPRGMSLLPIIKLNFSSNTICGTKRV